MRGLRALDAVAVSAQTKHITVNVLVDGGEISGLVGDGEDRAQLFIGWLGLIVALDGLLGIPGSTDQEQAAPR